MDGKFRKKNPRSSLEYHLTIALLFVEFCRVRVFKSRILSHFWEFKSRSFHFKGHCWSGVWTEDSKKLPDVLLSTPNYRVHFRWMPLRSTSLIAFYTNETFLNHVFPTWNLIPRAGYKRKILKKIPDVPLRRQHQSMVLISNFFIDFSMNEKIITKLLEF